MWWKTGYDGLNELMCRISQLLSVKVTSPLQCMCFKSGNYTAAFANSVKRISPSHIASRVLQFCKSLSVSQCFHHIQECPGHLAGLELVYTNELPFALQLPPTI